MYNNNILIYAVVLYLQSQLAVLSISNGNAVGVSALHLSCGAFPVGPRWNL